MAALASASPPSSVAATTATVVSLTFDDGLVNQYTFARPVLAARGVHGTFYVNTGVIGSDSNRMSWTQLLAVAADGNEIGGHTLTHADLTTLTTAEQQQQVCDDRSNLVAHGISPTSFAYPWNRYNASAKAVVAGCGYTSARGVGSLNEPDDPTYCPTCPYAESIPPGDPFRTRTPHEVVSTMTLTNLENYVLAAEQHGGGWLQFVIHYVCDSCTTEAISATTLGSFIDWVKARSAQGTVIKTVGEVMGGPPPPPQNQPPVAVVGADRSGGVAPVTVAFDGSGSSDPDGSVASYAWDLDGDGQFDDSAVQKPSFQYTAAGSYAVRLRVTDNGGAQGVSSPYTITVTSASSSGYSGAVLADGPVGYWRLGEGSGSVAGDASGSGRSGSYLGGPSLGQPGALVGDANTAVGFDGVGQYVSVPFAAALNGAQFSVEAWVYVTGGSGRWRSVVSSRDIVGGLNRGYIVYAAPDDSWRFWVGGGGSGWNQVYGPTLALNTWTHLVGTYDGVTARLYVNGVLAGSSAYSYVANGARPLRIAAGANERGADYLFPGRIDEVAVYANALSAARVQAHTTAGRG